MTKPTYKDFLKIDSAAREKTFELFDGIKLTLRKLSVVDVKNISNQIQNDEFLKGLKQEDAYFLKSAVGWSGVKYKHLAGADEENYPQEVLDSEVDFDVEALQHFIFNNSTEMNVMLPKILEYVVSFKKK